MSPDLSFQNNLLLHLEKQQNRADAEKQRRLWTTELFRQTMINSREAHQIRESFLSFQTITTEVKEVVEEIIALTPVLVWVWDQIKNNPNLLSHLKTLEDKVRLLHHHHQRHGRFFELYERNHEKGLEIFHNAIRNVVRIFEQGDSWLDDPTAAIQQVHEAQDGVAVTGLFLELAHEAIIGKSGITEIQTKQLELSIEHLRVLGNKLHLKEERIHKLLS
jgi:hypothetical protein